MLKKSHFINDREEDTYGLAKISSTNFGMGKLAKMYLIGHYGDLQSTQHNQFGFKGQMYTSINQRWMY